MYDTIIVGSGVSGSFIARDLTAAGRSCLMLEAGTHFTRETFPDNEMDANARLFWSGGIELNTDVDLALLRPKCVGGGSIVNQALLDRFDDSAFADWRKASEISYLNETDLDPYYQQAEKALVRSKVPEHSWNENVRIFRDGFEQNGFKWGALTRGQSDCRYEHGNDCIECLGGCPVGSKQSMPETVLKTALTQGLDLRSETYVERVSSKNGTVSVYTRSNRGIEESFRAKSLVLAAGSIGNSTIMIRSGFQTSLPAIGKGFYAHPQEMTLAIYDREISAFKGGFQALKSADPTFREQGFKLENVFGPPASLAMLIKDRGFRHQLTMSQIKYMACIEVAVRDTNPGTISLDKRGKVKIEKVMNGEDLRRKAKGLEAIAKIFKTTGAKKIINGDISIGLHLMGGMAIGKDRNRSVVDPDFMVHGYKNVFVADSSIFPTAPGLNPSLTIMALSLKAAEVMKAHG